MFVRLMRGAMFPDTDVFRAASEAGVNDILKLYNFCGNIMSISPKLPENTPETRYQLSCIAAHYNGNLTETNYYFNCCFLCN